MIVIRRKVMSNWGESMEKTFRIAWYSVVEDESVLEGRSLITAPTQEKAIEQLLAKKSQEYRLKPYMVQIRSIFEVTNGQ